MVPCPKEILSGAVVAREGEIVLVFVLAGTGRLKQRPGFSGLISSRACRVHPALIEANRLSGIRWGLRLLLLRQERSDARRIESDQFGKDAERIRELAIPETR